ncbi:unnamed protein product [Protopolystoma xenopodis]|uniref:Uncharacterized protein n=1 Tax=Protopolystoma xenopodis TaxID=117903 RepID=A0A3S5A5U6_9PLAT|nr:unnamed protein product [Protopolystoma xenopodis]
MLFYLSQARYHANSTTCATGIVAALTESEVRCSILEGDNSTEKAQRTALSSDSALFAQSNIPCGSRSASTTGHIPNSLSSSNTMLLNKRTSFKAKANIGLVSQLFHDQSLETSASSTGPTTFTQTLPSSMPLALADADYSGQPSWIIPTPEASAICELLGPSSQPNDTDKMEKNGHSVLDGLPSKLNSLAVSQNSTSPQGPRTSACRAHSLVQPFLSRSLSPVAKTEGSRATDSIHYKPIKSTLPSAYAGHWSLASDLTSSKSFDGSTKNLVSSNDANISTTDMVSIIKTCPFFSTPAAKLEYDLMLSPQPGHANVIMDGQSSVSKADLGRQNELTLYSPASDFG